MNAKLSIAALLVATSAVAQTTPAPTPQPTSQVPCAPTKQALPKIPEIVRQDGKLKGTIILVSEKNRIPERSPLKLPNQQGQLKSAQQGQSGTFTACYPQWVRAFRSPDATPPYATIPDGGYGDPMLGPTLRARVGDMVELTFINNVNPSVFANSRDGGAGIDRGDSRQCDDTSAGYPGHDTYPNCFHGSTTANIHFHGTHTNPNTTGDNVFLEVLSSQRLNGNPMVKPSDVNPIFDPFYKQCESELATALPREWPRKWSELPDRYTAMMKDQLTRFDSQAGTINKVWPVNEQELANGAWPQYYIGSYPYCFRLPELKDGTTPAAPDTSHATHMMGMGGAESQGNSYSPFMTPDPPRMPLQMGQAPGTHWYHAHKHGSTTINVSNGMTGVFIIEGASYDDVLNENYKAYGAQWTRTQPVLAITQIGVSPNLMKGAGQDRGPQMGVNGRLNPVINMAPGEVQLWRIVNTNARAGVQFNAPPPGFHWRQLAQDGVQFKNVNYLASEDKPILLASGNRADILIQAPNSCNGTNCMVPVQVNNTVDPGNLSPLFTLLTVNITGKAPNPAMTFIAQAPKQPDFLADIPDSAVKGTKIIDFNTIPQQFNTSGPPKDPAAVHMIDGKQFDGDVGALIRLNTVEEWTVRNFALDISHPFHIHINPFQVVEQFKPATVMADGNPMYITNEAQRKTAAQIYLDPSKPETWHSSTPASSKDAIWWDVMPIPSALGITDAQGNPVNDKNGNQLTIPGYFKMRSRFVDYAGFYVIHCHILAHEDRGMMTVVEVAPSQSPYSHH